MTIPADWQNIYYAESWVLAGSPYRISDYHLKSEDWRWNPSQSSWTWDDVTSRCIDAGSPGSPLGQEDVEPDDFGENLRINMGAYGGTAEASMPPYGWAALGDLTNDGIVNLEDFAAQVSMGALKPATDGRFKTGQ